MQVARGNRQVLVSQSDLTCILKPVFFHSNNHRTASIVQKAHRRTPTTITSRHDLAPFRPLRGRLVLRDVQEHLGFSRIVISPKKKYQLC
jgi:hypothetical protein